MIKFTSVIIEGFGTIQQPLVYVLNNNGINLIQAPNGTGKTTILDALCWAIYGQTLKGSKDITPWKPIKEFKGTLVSVNIDTPKGYVMIQRCKDYKDRLEMAPGKNRTLLYINGVYQENLRDKTDVQKAINDLMGMSFNLFKNSIVFGQGLTRLLQVGGVAQKQIFDEAFEVTYINTAKDKAQKEIITITEELEQQYNRAASYEERLEANRKLGNAYKEQKEEIRTRLKDIESKKADVYVKLQSAIGIKETDDKTKARYKEAELKMEVNKKLEDELFQKEFLLGQLMEELKDAGKKFRDHKVNKARRVPICPTCGQPVKNPEANISMDDKLVQLRAEMDNTQHKHNRMFEDVKSLKNALENLKPSVAEFLKLKKVIENLKNSKDLIKEYKAARLEYEAEGKKLIKKKNALNTKLSELRDLHGQLIKEKIAIDNRIAPLNKKLGLHKWLIMDPLSNKGLKAYIFGSMLDEINERLLYYAKYTNLRVLFQVDLESANKNFEAIVTLGQTQVPYETLSGGEKQLVDIALAFSIHDVMTKQRKFNILIMDEVFESLDAKNVDLISELLSVKAQFIGLHLITHQQDMRFGRVIQTTRLKKTKRGTILDN